MLRFIKWFQLWLSTSGLLVCLPLLACLWDIDSLAVERSRFPEAHELIVGHFPRHSEAYYHWRIEDRRRTEESEWTPKTFDDVAVAYDKLGQHEKALETIQRKMERFPSEGLYESLANRGTFLIHNGQLEDGLEFIRQAIEVNPNAHFGREIYQQLLVEFILQQEDGGEVNFSRFVLKKHEENPEYLSSDLRKALQGVLGMMRFGNHQSPILLSAAGDLLLGSDPGSDPKDDAKMLAARAYLRAAEFSQTPAQSENYRQKAWEALEMQKNRSLEEIEKQLKKEVAQADALAKSIAEAEAKWIQQGENVDRRFQQAYLTTPDLILENPEAHPASDNQILLTLLAVLGAGFVAILVGIAWAIRIVIRTRASAKLASAKLANAKLTSAKLTSLAQDSTPQ